MIHTSLRNAWKDLERYSDDSPPPWNRLVFLTKWSADLRFNLHVERSMPFAGRLTRDIDILVRRDDLAEITKVAESFGFRYRHAAGLDMLLDADAPDAASAVHLIFARERVRPEHVEASPDLAPERLGDAWVAPVAHLVRMKLTSYRFKDRAHLKDMEQAGLLTPGIEATLSSELRRRLDEVRAGE